MCWNPHCLVATICVSRGICFWEVEAPAETWRHVVEFNLERNLIPKFSIRQMLWLMVAIGIVSACLAGASRGSPIGLGLAVAMIATLIPLFVGGVVYWVVFGLAQLIALLSGNRPSSPPSVVEATAVDAAVAEPMQEGPADA